MMKKLTVNKGFVGLVFHKGDYKKLLTEGSYWLPLGREMKLFNLAKAFVPPVELNLLLEDKALAGLLTVIDVKDTEIVLTFENGNFKQILIPGRYAFWKGPVVHSFTTIDLSKKEITEDISKTLFLRSELMPYLRVYLVESYEKGVLFTDGEFEKILEPGVYYYWNAPEKTTVLKADLRRLQLEISGQDILTKDKAAIRVNFYSQYKITDISKSLIENKDFEKQLYIMIQLALREFIGTLTLDELLEKKQSVTEYIKTTIPEKADELGVKILDCGIRDIILPGDVKEIMNQVLIAQKQAQANIITRREETASTRSLLNTAKLMEENDMLFKLKEMEYVEKIAEKITSISLAGGDKIIDQLKDIFSTKK